MIRLLFTNYMPIHKKGFPPMNNKKTLIVSLMASSLILSGCGAVGLATGVGAAVGVSAAKEGGIRSSVTDENIRLQISDLWFKKDVDMFGKLNLNVNQGRVLVTGVVQNPEDRVEAIRLAWQPKGVKQVINEIRVGESGTIGTYAEDTWISGQLRTRLTFDKYVQSINYSIETVHGSVYLMGVAQNQKELDRVIGISREIKGVKEVISYVKLLGEPVTSMSSATSATPTPSGSGNYGNNGYGGYDNGETSAPTPLASEYDDSQPAYTPPASASSPAAIESEVLPP